jgi:hypothetical protein
MCKPANILLALVLGIAFLAAPSSRLAAATPSLEGDATHPGSASWIRCEIYFGIGGAGDTDLQDRELRWRDFLDREVTPRFPAGLTVLEAYGQWKSPGAPSPERLVSKVLVILCPDSAESRTSIDAIRTAYKAATHSKSVLLVVQPADVSF